MRRKQPASVRTWRLDVVAESVILLFFLQSLLALVESGYSFGLLSKDLPPEAVAVLFLFSPALLWVMRSEPPLWQRRGLVAVAVACRLVFPLAPDPGWRLLLVGISVSCWLVLLVLLIQGPHRRFATQVHVTLSIALLALVLFRVLGSGLDWSLGGPGQLVAWPLGALLLGTVSLAGSEEEDRRSDVFDPAIGLMGCVALIVTVFSAPNVVARWGDFSYELMAGSLLCGVVVLALVERWLPMSRVLLLTAGGAVVVLLALTTLPLQVDFPGNQASYPFYEDPPGWTAALAAALMFIAPIVLRSAGLCASAIAEARPSLQRCAMAFSLGSALLLALFFAQILTITYDYVPVVGPLFRDRFWLVMTVMGLVPVIAVWRTSAPISIGRAAAPPEMAAMMVLVAMAAGGFLLLRASPEAQPDPDGSLTVVTFNIQQGFLRDGGPGARRQLEALRELRPDIVGLQESDTNRISSGNQDVVRYFAEKLDMHSFYGPSPVVGSFGVALLSRYPIEGPRTFYLWSEGEQTAGISAQVRVGQRRFNVFVTHLGNGGPLEQQQNVLQEAAGHEHVLLLGDFNFRPGSEQYDATLAVLADSWGLNEAMPDEESIEVQSDAIDHIFASPSVRVLSARYLDDRVFDHPIYVIEVALTTE